MQEPIDFDAASAAWMANKIRKGAMLYYKCQASLKSGEPCKLASVETVGEPHFCKRHAKQKVNERPCKPL